MKISREASLEYAALLLARSLTDEMLHTLRVEWGNTNVAVLKHWQSEVLRYLEARPDIYNDVKRIVERMRSEKPRMQSRDAGDVVSSYTVDNWADELEEIIRPDTNWPGDRGTPLE